MKLRTYLRVMRTKAGLDFSRIAAFRASFIIDFLTTSFRNFLWPLVTVIIYSQTNGFPGWSLGEFILFQGTIALSFAIAGLTVFSIVWVSGDLIDSGTFDQVLIRPMKVIPSMLAYCFNPWWIQDVLSGLVIAMVGLVSAGWIFNLINLLMYAALIISSLMVWFFFACTILSLNFKYPRAKGLFDLFFRVKELGNYPLNVYGSVLQFLLTFVIPFGIAGFYPAQAILGQMTDITQFCTIIGLSSLFAFIGYLVLNKSVKNYESVGG